MHKGSVDIWICRAESWLEQKELFFSELSAQEQQRAMRFNSSEHSNCFIVFHGFMRRVLAQYLGVKPSSLSFKRGDNGKPYLVFPDSSSRIFFNLSHTDTVALLAVAVSEVGLDVEFKSRKTDWQGVAKRFFTASEQQALFSLDSVAQQKNAFFDLWTRKEAYMKVLGCGLALSPTQFSLTVAPQAPALVEHKAINYRPETGVFFKTLCLPKELSAYCATLAALDSIEQCQVKEF